MGLVLCECECVSDSESVSLSVSVLLSDCVSDVSVSQGPGKCLVNVLLSVIDCELVIQNNSLIFFSELQTDEYNNLCRT